MSTPRICPNCGGTHMTPRRAHHHFVESGLDNVHLVNVPIVACAACGEEIISIPQPTQLMKCIAEEGVLLKPAPLSGPEIRFLRKNLMLKVVEFARLLGVDRVTVSRWENGHEKPARPTDRFIRLLYANQAMVRPEVAEKLRNHLGKEEEDRQLDYFFPVVEQMVSCGVPGLPA
jgi:putative transcriptional regulator